MVSKDMGNVSSCEILAKANQGTFENLYQERASHL
jgi:hypothetical protein